MSLQCEICGKPALVTALRGRLCTEHYPNERQCTRCGAILWGWPTPPEFDPCSTCQTRERLPELTKTLTDEQREAISRYLHLGQTVQAVRILREASDLSIRDASEIAEAMAVETMS